MIYDESSGRAIRDDGSENFHNPMDIFDMYNGGFGYSRQQGPRRGKDEVKQMSVILNELRIGSRAWFPTRGQAQLFHEEEAIYGPMANKSSNEFVCGRNNSGWSLPQMETEQCKIVIHCCALILLEIKNKIKIKLKLNTKAIDKVYENGGSTEMREGNYIRKPKIQIFIRDFLGKLITMEVPSEESVFKIKEQVADNNKIKMESFQLFYLGRRLCDDCNISHYKIRHGATIIQTMRLLGGSIHGDELVDDLEDELEEALAEKRIRKCRLTKSRNRFRESIISQEKGIFRDKYEEDYEETIDFMNKLLKLSRQLGDKRRVIEIERELSEIEEKNDIVGEDIVQKMENRLQSVKHNEDGLVKEKTFGLQLDNLKRITIPKFSGRIREYQDWKAAFHACVHNAHGEKTLKLMHLRQYLEGDAARLVSVLGYSDTAYDLALERLEERYGGDERICNTMVEMIERFRPVRKNELKDLESLIELLDMMTLRYTDMKREADLGCGYLYQRILKKLPERMLTEWTKEVRRGVVIPGVKNLHFWLSVEANVGREVKEKLSDNTIARGFGSNDKKIEQKEEFGERHNRKYFNRTHLTVQEPNRRDETKKPFRKKCYKCGEEHFLHQCVQFRQMPVKDRREFVQESRLCFNCLFRGHVVQDCKKDKMCKLNNCDKKHSYWMHDEKPISISLNTREVEHMRSENTSLVTAGNIDKQDERHWISLRTVPVILSLGEKEIEINALLDDASTLSYVSERVARELNMSGPESILPVGVIGGRTEKMRVRMVSCNLGSEDGKIKKEIKLLAVDNITGNSKVINWREAGGSWKHLKKVPFPRLAKGMTVDLLIGADNLEMHRSIKEIAGEVGEPIARLTPLGWTCVGGKNIGLPWRHQSNFIRTYLSTDTSLDEQLQKFWEIEEIALENLVLSPRENLLKDEAISNIKYSNGRYEVKLPWKKDEGELPDNRLMAENRFQSLERKLTRDTKLHEEYERVIGNYEQKGYIRRLMEEEETKTKWILPHFPVVRRDKETTKVRIVFDAAAKCQGVCLNDKIEAGPKLQGDLFNILLRFRKNKIALVCDITEMFLQIKINEADRKYLRFIWKRNGKFVLYEFNRVVFGINASPFLAQLVSQENAKKHQEEYPRAAEVILNSTYMDDCMDSVKNETEAIQLKNDLKTIWKRAGMDAKKWATNSEEVLETISLEDRTQVLKIEANAETALKTLGVKWHALEDEFAFNVEIMEPEKITKRTFLSLVSKIFDPLGLISVFVIRGKIIMQKLWMSGVGWDEKVPANLEKEIKGWISETEELKCVRIPRCLINEIASEIEFHVFSDASSQAYGAVVYIREVFKDKIITRFIASKAKVSPLQVVSIPRLELMAACIGLKLVKRIIQCLEFEIDRVTLWTDSMDVLYWIRQYGKLFKPFVANRVGNIQKHSKISQWRYVPTKLNPADLLSRGVLAKTCGIENKLWWEGPEFLQNKTETEWPKTKIIEKSDEIMEKRRAVTMITVGNITNNLKKLVTCLDPKTYSNWSHLIRIRGWVNRFIQNCKLSTDNRKGGELDVEELLWTEKMVIKSDQKKYFEEELKKLRKEEPIANSSKIQKFSPILDKEGIIRGNSRIIYAEFLPEDTKYPIILSDESWITWLIIGDHHEKRNHYAGVNHLLSDITRKYNVIKARKIIRKYENQCVRCHQNKRLKGMHQMMAPLPAFRFMEPLRPFARVGVDFAGPFITIQGRGRRREKRYLCLFTCLQCRAVHLELAFGLDTDAFIRAFKRFIGRRGKPEMVISDNGTNFVGAVGEIVEITVDNFSMTKELAKERIRWIFNPPGAPHFGGVFESMIKSAKRAIHAVLGNAEVSDEELNTVIIKVEEMVNSRPLTYQTMDQKEGPPLTPNHFILAGYEEGKEKQISPGENVSLRKRWRRIDELETHMWKRWMREMIPMWRDRQKWRLEEKSVKNGDLVWILDKETTMGKWPIGMITSIITGTDGKCRVLKIRHGTKEICRPIAQVYPLPIEAIDSERGQERGNVVT